MDFDNSTDSISPDTVDEVITISGFGGLVLPNGTNAQRPPTNYAGILRFNTQLGKLEFNNGATWATLDVGTGGGGEGSSAALINTRAATTENISLASAPAAIDGVTLANTDLILVKNQTTGSENGVYTFNGAGSALTRNTLLATSQQAIPGLLVTVSEGAANNDSIWMLVTNDPIILGTTALTFLTQNAEAAISHNNILGLQGGGAGQYYHLTAEQYAVVVAQTPTVLVISDTNTATAFPNVHYVLTHPSASTITLPASPNVGDVVWVSVGNNRIDNAVNGNGQNIMSSPTNLVIDIAQQTVILRYINTTLGWILIGWGGTVAVTQTGGLQLHHLHATLLSF